MNTLELKGGWRDMTRGFLKMKKASDEVLLPFLEEAEKRLLPEIRPRFVYRIFPLEKRENGLGLGGCLLVLPGESIRAHLAGCDRAILLCVTLGEGADRAIRVAETEDMALAVVMDAMASAMTECACDQAEEQIREALEGNFRFASRFSPGYGDLGLEIQKSFLDASDAGRRIGLSVSSGGLLLPRKSVTAVIGMEEQ